MDSPQGAPTGQPKISEIPSARRSGGSNPRLNRLPPLESVPRFPRERSTHPKSGLHNAKATSSQPPSLLRQLARCPALTSKISKQTMVRDRTTRNELQKYLLHAMFDPAIWLAATTRHLLPNLKLKRVLMGRHDQSQSPSVPHRRQNRRGSGGRAKAPPSEPKKVSAPCISQPTLFMHRTMIEPEWITRVCRKISPRNIQRRFVGFATMEPQYNDDTTRLRSVPDRDL